MLLNLVDIESCFSGRVRLGKLALIYFFKLFFLILGLIGFLLCQVDQFVDARLFHSELLSSLIRLLVAVLSLLPFEFKDNRLQLILKLFYEHLMCLFGFRVLVLHHLLLLEDFLHAFHLSFERILEQLDALPNKLDETSSIAAYIEGNFPHSLLQQVLVFA